MAPVSLHVCWLTVWLSAWSISCLSLTKRCGEQVCEKYQLCAAQELVCYPCSKVCEKNSHNFNEKSCEENCQDYIHDYMLEYVRKCDIEDIIHRLYVITLISFGMLLFLVAIVMAIGGRYLYQWRKRNQLRKLEKKKYLQKLNSVQYSANGKESDTQEVIKTISQSMRDTMPSTITLTTQTESPGGSTGTSSTVMNTSPLSPHEACEDTTLDYAAYVNQALSHTPPANNSGKM